ncbi:uncharacterized protein LOC132277574 [Cornus florida]|uniref:uncharacterized protein LOC132277574 n=1 Tax=Cornus florida TaxID=4283 RepID=UPI0028A0E058|nr:uncharacterized protein LOC132277574 [Cornus florida]
MARVKTVARGHYHHRARRRLDDEAGPSHAQNPIYESEPEPSHIQEEPAEPTPPQSPSTDSRLQSSAELSPKSPRVEHTKVDRTFLERYPGLRRQIWDYPVEKRDEVHRAYIKAKAYQIMLSEYPLSGLEKHPRWFLSSWFKLFLTWLEYSPSNDVAFCLPYVLFGAKPAGHPKTNAFTSEGFRSWKKVNNGNKCAFLNHMGGSPCSAHNIAKRAFRWLNYQACAFRGHDESLQSSNRGNFIEMVKAFVSYNDDVAKIVLENVPKNAKYTSPQIQKEILHIISTKVRSKFREDIGDAKFCILIDEARDESKREQMALVLRYVDKDGFLQERFFDLVHVKVITLLNLKNDICAVLSHYNLDVHKLRGQSYDGDGNMRDEWNGLQALFLNDCPYAYYVHFLAHQLQLALVTTSKEVIAVH